MTTDKQSPHGSCILLIGLAIMGGCGVDSGDGQAPRGTSVEPDPVEAFHAEMIAESDRLWASVSASEAPMISNFREPTDLDVSIGCLEQILDGTNYSSRLAEAWLKWRCRVQLYSHGASNSSEIPNNYYNERRQAMIRVIQIHLKADPGDQDAERQLEFLLTAPDIQPLPVGNSAVIDWGMSGQTTGGTASGVDSSASPPPGR